MTNQIISVRIPKSLNNKLKDYALKNHYMDVSEVVRTLLRKKAMEFRDPNSHQLKEIKKDIFQKINKATSKKRYSTMVNELDSIKEQLLKKMGGSR